MSAAVKATASDVEKAETHIVARERAASNAVEVRPPVAAGEAVSNGVVPTAGGSVSPAQSEDDDDIHSISTELYEIILESEGYAHIQDDNTVCTPEERRAYQKRLHEVGVDQFIRETISAETITARKLCTAFGVSIPVFMEGYPDHAFYRLLGLAINREINKRRTLEQYKTIDDAAMLLKKSQNIIVITGAGISTSLGIPDFRSKNTGFYSRLRELGYQEPEEVFDIHLFDQDPTIFYRLAGNILPDLEKWSPTHEFIRLLQDKGKLLTNYTQNIDNVEAHAGIRKEKLIQCHGSWATATCRKCKYKIPGEELFPAIKAQTPAECEKCIIALAEQNPGLKRKRVSNGKKKRRNAGEFDSDSDEAYDIPQPGIMKPDITFFGEALPKEFFHRLENEDRKKVDLVIVMGTSMKVAPVSEIPNFFPKDVPHIYINRDPVNHINFDITLLGDCDTIVAELARRAGWELKHRMLPEEQKVDIVPVGEDGHVHSVKVRQPESNAT
ncbi:NAD-dependent histone deacetylase SIR2 [Westerdykella ornata]|uniref:NAD-dependent histone deacetylase SIR2 n=1 Tax=Westerdykella ornata TaxID=318751 RepID=A0A6A6JDS8_WESOR|nr:NAD-dependent histone deacetylase SIR2 [Westerdykella ornata]KAF2274572.1 NAD-dependent histone deacetylase SIR2 [Westerdykella ornata]